MGADLSRSLLTFSSKKRLGSSGLKWLKIHVANKMGKDKLTLYDREKYVEDNIQELRKWISDPIKHDDWLGLEDCW